MREIKFKAWEKNLNKMYHRVLVGPGDPCTIVYDDNKNDWVNFDKCSGYVMQYTGIKDKNGKEIYEGDIVKCIEATDSKIIEYISEVFWESCCFLVHESKMCDCELGMFEEEKEWKYPLTEIEVIGNIYENPALITVQI